MTTLLKFPVKTPRYRPKRKDLRIHDQPKPSDFMVWEVCAYVSAMHRAHTNADYTAERHKCKMCPAWVEDPDHGPVKHGCRLEAEEICQLVCAVQKVEEKR